MADMSTQPKFTTRIIDGNVHGHRHCEKDHGMALRDWFAGMAMQGILSNDPPQDRPVPSPGEVSEADEPERVFSKGILSFAFGVVAGCVLWGIGALYMARWVKER